MKGERVIELSVGLFLMLAIMSLMVLAFKISGLTNFFKVEGYEISAVFDDIGQLKVRAPIKIGGVTIGEVTHIQLDPHEYRAIVNMRIAKNINDIPEDSVATILTAGLLGDNYIAITPMYSSVFLKNGGLIQETHSAMILENLIGQLLFKVGNKTSAKGDSSTAKKEARL